MSSFYSFELENSTLLLQTWLQQQKRVVEFSNDDYSSLLLCYILFKEIGGRNDNLSQYIYDVQKKQKIDRKQLIVHVVTKESEPLPFVQIHLPQVKQLGVTLSYLREVITYYDNHIIISPSHIAAYLHSHHLTPVFVVPWIQQIFFSEFNVKSESVSDQLWVLRNNDIYLYSKLVSEKKIVCQSSHDVVGHIAGTTSDGIAYAAEVAAHIHSSLHSYFGNEGRGNLPSHLLPFLIGLLLDDLTQPPNYFSEKHTQAINEFLIAMDKLDIDPSDALVLNGFPKRINTILQMIREKNDFSFNVLKNEIEHLLEECKPLISIYNN